mmetsp:Transcript_96323/g.272368  ORF Transcript_96323/g.272368 Transcript_96323/m.272368 type:complete len:205 (+) Transcript_96323:280-894(+)
MPRNTSAVLEFSFVEIRRLPNAAAREPRDARTSAAKSTPLPRVLHSMCCLWHAWPGQVSLKTTVSMRKFVTSQVSTSIRRSEATTLTYVACRNILSCWRSSTSPLLIWTATRSVGRGGHGGRRPEVASAERIHRYPGRARSSVFGHVFPEKWQQTMNATEPPAAASRRILCVTPSNVIGGGSLGPAFTSARQWPSAKGPISALR